MRKINTVRGKLLKHETLNDNLLAQLFLELQKDFKTQQQAGKSVEEIVQYLGENLYWTIESGHLKHLRPEEKHKSYQVLDIVIQSMNAYQNLPKQEKKFEIPRSYSSKEIHHHHYHDRLYFNQFSPFSTWYHLSQWSRPTYIVHHHYDDRRRKDKKDDSFAKLVLFLTMLALMSSAFILSFFALREMIDCGDRIVHNEGILRALFSMSLMTVAGLTGAFIATVLLAGPLATLAVAAGTSVGVVNVVATAAMTMIGSGTVGLLFSQFKLQEYFIGKNNKTCIDPSEPERFSLTKHQEQHLEDIGLDITKVKCAMVAIRSAMASDHVQDKLWRMFSSKGQAHELLLEQLRDLKDGKCRQNIKVGDMMIDLRAPDKQSAYYYHETTINPTEPPPYVVEPSAPPMEQTNNLYPDLHGIYRDAPPPTYGQTQQFTPDYNTQGAPFIYPDLTMAGYPRPSY